MESELEHNLKDKTIICVDCGNPFHFSIGEQLFFASKRLSDPKRCASCRRKRRRTLNPDPRIANFDDIIARGQEGIQTW